eukprot:gene1562-2195_t
MSWRPINIEENTVEFFFEVAYRRDFDWGRYFREQWAVGPTDSPVWTDGGSCYTDESCTVIEGSVQAVPELYYQTFPETDNKELYTGPGGTGGYYIRLAVGRSYYKIDDLNNRICQSPYDTGDSPTCPNGVATGTKIQTSNIDSECKAGTPISEWMKQAYGGAVQCRSDYLVPYDLDPTHIDPSIPCEADENDTPDYCSPWSSTYGFFFGDGNVTDIVLTVIEVDFEDTSVGNYIRAKSVFQHQYPTSKDYSQFEAYGRPWTAFFTGGNRITRTKDFLQNNGNGRFRLEITVNIVRSPEGVNNHSPIATSIPVLPVPYNGRDGLNSPNGMLANFELSAYDPDIDPDAYQGNKEVHNQEVFYFVANIQKYGYLLANQVPDLKYPSRWYEASYEAQWEHCYNKSCANEDGELSCDYCKKGDGKICTTVIAEGEDFERDLEFSCEEYPHWNNSQNLAHPPPNLKIDVYEGIVWWETGIHPYSIDLANYSTNIDHNGDNIYDFIKGTFPGNMTPIPQGFYNLVVDIRSESGDHQDCVAFEQSKGTQGDLEALCTNSQNCDLDRSCALDNYDAPELAYVSVPLDFLMYLYPPASWCSKVAPSCLHEQPGIYTFRDDGFYGDAISPEEEEEFGGAVKYMYDAPGTGRCTICGGGNNFTNMSNPNVCLQGNDCGLTKENGTYTVLPLSSVCEVNNFPRFIAPTPEQNFLLNERWATVYGKRSKPVYFTLHAEDLDECVELRIYTSGLFKGSNFHALLPGGFVTNETACTYEESSRALNDMSRCPWDMQLLDTEREGTAGDAIERPFVWPVGYLNATTGEHIPDMIFDDDYNQVMPDGAKEYPQDQDPRPPNTIVCFYPFDNYVLGEFRCINIILTSDKALYWMDKRPQLLDIGDDFQGQVAANETAFYVTPGNTLTFIMEAKQGTNYEPVGVYIVQGELPRGATFEYNNTDPLLRDPARRTFEWTPDEGQQCEYLICFSANNSRVDPSKIDYVAQFDTANSLDERCYTIVVMDQTLDFDGGTYVNAPLVLPLLTAECGMSMGIWFYPEGTTAMPLLTMGYTMPGETTKNAVHRLAWEPVTAAVFNDGVTSQDLGQLYRLVYTSEDSGTVIMTDADFCIVEWHFAMVTIAPDGSVILYLDGIEVEHYAEDTRDFHNIGYETGTVPVTDGKVEIIGTILGSKPGSQGFFYFGSYEQPFDGKITDVRVYSRALHPHEVREKMFKPLVAAEEIGLEAYYKFNEGSQYGLSMGNSEGSFNKYGRKFNSTPAELMLQGDTTNDGQVDSPLYPYPDEMDARFPAERPIIDYSGNAFHAYASDTSVTGNLHYEFHASPTMPACPKEFSPDNVHVDGGRVITISGSGFAKSQWLKCSFTMSSGEAKIVKASYVNNNTITCVNPGSPDVTASMLEVTNGYGYSDMKIPLYIMERGLSIPRQGGSVTVTDVCSDIGEYGFAFGGWVYPIPDSETGRSDGAVFTLTDPSSSSDGTIEVVFAVPAGGVGEFQVYEQPLGGSRVQLGKSHPAPPSGGGAGAGWHYVMLTATRDYEFELYVDGEKSAGSGIQTPTVKFQSNCDFVVGRDGQDNAMIGIYEEVSLWSKHLTVCQSIQLMWGQLVRTELCPEGDSITTQWNDKLVTYLKMNDYGDIADDASGKSRDGVRSEQASFMFTTVPFLAPSFNRPRPRLGAQTKQFDYGPNQLMMENYTLPRQFYDYYEYVVFPKGEIDDEYLNMYDVEDSLYCDSPACPAESRGASSWNDGNPLWWGQWPYPGTVGDPSATPQLKSPVLSVDGKNDLKLLGFGFAESQWLKCEFMGELVDATYIGMDEVDCAVGAAPYPGKFPLGVLNYYPWKLDQCQEEEDMTLAYRKRNWTSFYANAQANGNEVRLVNYVPDLEMKESAMYFDGEDDYIFSQEVAVFDVVNGAMEPYTQVCMHYKNQSVYISSELTSATYNHLWVAPGDNPGSNESLANGWPAPVGQWHYAEITIDGVETDPFIVSDGENVTSNIPTYIARMTVDNHNVNGSDVEPRGDIRIPIHPESLIDGGFFVGGVGCDEPELNAFYTRRRSLLQERSLSQMIDTNVSFHFRGLIDEVRVFKGVHKTDWQKRLPDVSMNGTVQPIAHYRMTATSGNSTTLYEMRPDGSMVMDFSGNDFHAKAYEFGKYVEINEIERKADPEYIFVDAPWEPVTTFSVSVDEMMLEGGEDVIVKGYNVPVSEWLYCIYGGVTVSNETDMHGREMSFDAYHIFDATYIDGETVSCPSPGAAVPNFGYVQIAGPQAVQQSFAAYTYRESVLEFEGDQVLNSEVVGGTANEGERIDLVCPEGMRMDKVLFASYGRPKGRCNAHQITNCDLTKTWIPCDYMGYEVNDQCHSDNGKPPYFSIDRVESHCYGKFSCSIPSSNAVFGDPCPSTDKWLSVALRCSDRWSTKDYIQADTINAHLTAGEFTFGAWVYPHSKNGIQAVVSFGGAPDQDLLNRHILQWRGDETGNSGRFYYYDDCIYDVLMKYDDGRDIILATHQWYYITLSMQQDGTGMLMLNGIPTATWTTTCRPDPMGSFTLGMDMSDEMYPKEFFDGLMDEVVVYDYPLPMDMIQGYQCWDSPSPYGLVAYYKFNSDFKDFAKDGKCELLAEDDTRPCYPIHGNMASSSDTIWDAEKGAFTDNITASVHTSLKYMGVPWFPTHTQSVIVPGGNQGQLAGGMVVTMRGLNFATRSARVFYMDKEIPYTEVNDRYMTAVIPNLKEPPTCTEGGASELKVINNLDATSSETCNVGHGTVYEDRPQTKFTQQLDVKDLQDGLICYFPFYNDVADYSGYARHGDNEGAMSVTNRNGYPTQAYAFGEDDHISIEHCDGGRTVAMWIYYEDLDFPHVNYLNVPLEAYEVETGCQVSLNSSLNNAWMHIVGVVDDNMVETLYVNGKPSQNTKYFEQILSILFEQKIGGDDFVGKIDDVWIWDRELCESEILETYASQEYAIELGFGTEVEIPLVSNAQGSEGLLASFFGAGIEHFEVLTVLQQDYATLAPASGFSVDEWSVELTGYIYAPYSSEYYFTISADDSFRLWINRGEMLLPEHPKWNALATYWHDGTYTSWGPDGPSPHAGWTNIINSPCTQPECTPEREIYGNTELEMGWYEIYMSYTDKRGSAAFSLRWETTDHNIQKQLINKAYLRSGTGPFTVEAWIWPYVVDGYHTVVSRTIESLNGLGVGITQGGMSASIYTGCMCSVPKCDEYREVSSWRTVIEAEAWQHISAQYDGNKWMLYVDGVQRETVDYDNVRFFGETNSPIMLGRENTQEIIQGFPLDIRQFYGLIESFNMWSVPHSPTIRCPTSGPRESLVIYLKMDEGVGKKMYDHAGHTEHRVEGANIRTLDTPIKQIFQDAIITPPAEPYPLWVRLTKDYPSPVTRGSPCSTWGTDPSKTEISGTALSQGVAGHCSVFTITSFDQCGHKKLVGGDQYYVQVVGPTHLHTMMTELEIGDGITDHGDGSYTVNFIKEASGYYKIIVYSQKPQPENGDKDSDNKLDTFTMYNHAYIADSKMSYMYDDLDDPLYLDEIEYSMAGIPVNFMLQTVDMYGNLRTEGGIADWQISFTGPYDFNGTWADNDDGTYTFSYNAQVAGYYRMTIRMFGEPISEYGGKTCCGGAQSAYSYCTLNKTPGSPDYVEDSTFCVKVIDGSSLQLSPMGTYASFPDSDELDLESPFTIYAFVKKGVASGASREYVVSKQSEYSGKGYWLAILPTSVADEYELEGGVYVGAENFRIARQVVAVPMGEWVHLGMTYSGTELKLYVDASLVESNSYDEMLFEKRNSQPLRVGKDFSGLLDNVLIFSEVRDLEHFVPDSFCPVNVDPKMTEKGLIAYYRFNENGGFATKDSSTIGNDGILGLVCDMVPEGKTAKLSCPTGYKMTDFLYTNFGDNDGGCGAYEMGDCSSAESYAVVNASCYMQNECTVLASKAHFPVTCATTSKSLAINAVCSPDSTTTASWSMDTAPTLVSVTTATEEDFICPFDYMGTGIFPAWMEKDLTDEMEAGASCSMHEMNKVDIRTAQAGRTMVWGLIAKDGCGYRSIHGTDEFTGEIEYPLYHNLSMSHTCPDLPMTKVKDEVTMQISGSREIAGEPTYCGTYNNIYINFYHLEVTGVSHFTFRMNQEPFFEAVPLIVIPADISAQYTYAEGSGLYAGEAGVETMFKVVAYDHLGNLRMMWGDESALAVEVLNGPASAATAMELAPIPGEYFFYITYPLNGTYDVLVAVNGEPVSMTTAAIERSKIRPMTDLFNTHPPPRFEHSMVSYKDEVYFFGGARADKTYLDEMMKLNTGFNSEMGAYNYRRLVVISNMPETDYNVELTMDTASHIESGRLKPDCSDLRFLDMTGMPLKMWVEPSTAPAGCGKTDTLIWIKVPGGMSEFWMYYGNKAAPSMSDPFSVFDIFEDFEGDSTLESMGWALDSTTSDACTTDSGYNPGDMNSFYTTNVTSMHGKMSLKMDTVEMLGGAIMKDVAPMKKFTLKAYMYDSYCDGSHWISPDFKTCQPIPNMKSMLPNMNNGMGIYTGASTDTYSVTYPWHMSPAERSVGWHSFTMRDDDKDLTLTVDEYTQLPLRSHDISTDIDKIFLNSQRIGDQKVGSSVYWDAIFVSEYDPMVSAAYMAEEFVSFDRANQWSKVGETNPPPARQAHTAVVYDDAMYVFGGERSAYEYSDLWKYTFEGDAWEFQATVNSSSRLGRHDHTAVVYGDSMYVYGGRAPMPKADMWAYSFSNKTWSEQPHSPGMEARFGHSAAVSGGVMYVYGGYTVGGEDHEAGLTDEIWSYKFESMEWTKVGPRYDNYEKPWMQSPTDAIIFPMMIPSPRFAHSAVITGERPALYIMGGAGGESMMEELHEIWKFDLELLEWEFIGSHPLLGRYDSAAVLYGEDKFALVYGGHAAGTFLGDVVLIFIGDTGL